MHFVQRMVHQNMNIWRGDMNLVNQIVVHKIFGEGTVVTHDDKYLTIFFAIGEKKFTFPDAFNNFLTAKDSATSNKITILLKEAADEILRNQQETEQMYEFIRQSKAQSAELKTKKSSVKTYPRANIAFKCNFCDGGQSESQIGFAGVCSDENIFSNIKIENRTWCNSTDCACFHYYIEKITRRELVSLFENGHLICYESQMLNHWKARAGIVQNGEHKGKPMRLNQVQANSLCVLTTRDPQSKEDDRYIFAVFLVDETYEGDERKEGYVGTQSKLRIKLMPKEARSLLFWNYHANKNNSDVAMWNTGLHRYLEDVQAAQILRDIAIVKKRTEDETLASEFYQYFCVINGIETSSLGEPAGALHIRMTF